MTHNERVLRLLSDCEEHSHHELYALHVIAHSRVSDLRRQGYKIAQWREGDLYLYQLVGWPLDAEDGCSEGTGGPVLCVEQADPPFSRAACSSVPAPERLGRPAADCMGSGASGSPDGAGAGQLSVFDALDEVAA